MCLMWPTLLLVGLTATTGVAGSVDVATITKAQKHRESYFRDYRAHLAVRLEEYQDVDGDVSLSRLSHTEADIILWSGKAFFSTRTRSEKPLTGEELRRWGVDLRFDGHLTGTDYVGASNAIIEEGDALSNDAGFRIYASVMLPKLARGPTSPLLYLDEYVEKYYDSSTVSLQPTGNELLLLEGSLKNGWVERMWFDGGQDFVLTKQELRDGTGKLLSQEVWVYDVDDQGRYLPRSREANAFSQRGEVIGRNVAEVTELVFDEEPDPCIFEIKFPPGKLVFDKRANMTFKVDEDGRLLPAGVGSPLKVEYAVPNRLDDVTSESPPDATEPGVRQQLAEEPVAAPAPIAATVPRGSNVFVVIFALLALSFFVCLVALLVVRTKRARAAKVGGDDS